jgi:hypothetical protein
MRAHRVAEARDRLGVDQAVIHPDHEFLGPRAEGVAHHQVIELRPGCPPDPFDDLRAGHRAILVCPQPAHLADLAEEVRPAPLGVQPAEPSIPPVHDREA